MRRFWNDSQFFRQKCYNISWMFMEVHKSALCPLRWGDSDTLCIVSPIENGWHSRPAPFVINRRLLTANFSKSEQLYEEALKHIVGGVNSPSCSYKAVGGGVGSHGTGQRGLLLGCGRQQIYWLLRRYGPIITGHAHPHITEAIKSRRNGVLYGTRPIWNTICQNAERSMPNLESALTNSGPKRSWLPSALPAFTGRDKIIKFAGCYHAIPISFGRSRLRPFHIGHPDSAGVPKASPKMSLPFL